MGLLPIGTAIVGYARSHMTDTEANNNVRKFLKGTDAQRDAFLALCTYRAGAYDDSVAFSKVRERSVSGTLIINYFAPGLTRLLSPPLPS